jgi:hypothetical protein
MAGFIEVNGEESWSSSNWVYWSVIDHVLDAFSTDAVVANRVERCKWMQMLSFPLLRSEDEVIAEKVLSTLDTVARKCTDGVLTCKVDGRLLDEASQQQFRESARELVDLLGRSKGVRPL